MEKKKYFEPAVGMMIIGLTSTLMGSGEPKPGDGNTPRTPMGGGAPARKVSALYV